MDRLPSNFSGRKDFFIVNFNYTIDEIFEMQKNIINLRYWMITLWTAALGFSLSATFSEEKLSFLLISISVTFLLINIFQVAIKDRQIEIAKEMEIYLSSISEKAILSETRTLWEIAITMFNDKKRTYSDFLKEAARKHNENYFYYFLIIASLIISIIFCIIT